MSALWFRRPRRTDASQDAGGDAAGPERPRQQRAPLRIRNLLLLNLQPSEGAERIEKAPPLGSRAAVMAVIRSAVPGVQFDGTRGQLAGAGYRITVDVGAGDPVPAAVAAADGDTGIELLRTLLEQSGWRAYAPRAGVFVRPDAIDLFALPQAEPPVISDLP
jgi:hypothetical protein